MVKYIHTIFFLQCYSFSWLQKYLHSSFHPFCIINVSFVAFIVEVCSPLVCALSMCSIYYGHGFIIGQNISEILGKLHFTPPHTHTQFTPYLHFDL
jgi:hypothetical protein